MLEGVVIRNSKGEKTGFHHFSFSHNDFKLLIFQRSLKIGNSVANIKTSKVD